MKPIRFVSHSQRMPANFTAAFAKNLCHSTNLDVAEGGNGTVLKPGTVTILPGGTDCEVIRHSGTLRLKIAHQADAPVHPYADVLFESAAQVSKCQAAVILTGMGKDGTRGSRPFAEKGYPVLVQDFSTCVIDGMPKRAYEAGNVSHVMTLEDIGKQIKTWTEG